jgi:hypothetical protein
MDRDNIVIVLEKAIDYLIINQAALLDLDVTERALSHYLAIYIAQLIPDVYDVDVEYNRHGGDPKRLNLPPRQALDREVRATTVFPDIVVHRRNTDDENLLVIEVKKPGEDTAYDHLKLQAFRNELGYRNAAHVILGRAGGCVVREIIWIDD